MGQAAVCLSLPRPRAPGSLPSQHERPSFLFREKRGKGWQGQGPLSIWKVPPWDELASECGRPGEGARAACQGGLPFSAEV